MTHPQHDTGSDVRRRLVPLLAGVTVLVVLLGGGYALRHASNVSPGAGTVPPPLRLADYQQPAAALAGSNSFRLSGTLPDGPAKASVRWLTSPQRSDSDRLAKALGISGHVTTGAGATTYTSGSASLRVQQGAGGQWQYSRTVATDLGVACPPGFGPETSGSGAGAPKTLAQDPSLAMRCDVAHPVPLAGDSASGTTTSQSTARPQRLVVTTEAMARTAARPVLDAVGLDADTAVVWAGQPQAIVGADPTIGGLATQGLTTSVTVSGTRVESASGWLGRTRAGSEYPVISATAAWKQLQRTPMMRPMLACVEKAAPDSASGAGRDPLMCGGPIVVTGARFGLSLHEDSGRQVLVPSWLFDVRNSGNPLAVVAIDPRYLSAPSGPPIGGIQPGSGGSGSSGSSGGSTGSGGTVVPPVAPSTDPGSSAGGTAPDSLFSSVTSNAAGTELTVTFSGGVDPCYSYSVAAAETGKQVALTLVSRTSSTKQSCIEIAKIYERRVHLAQPLGTRQVVDARSGAVLLP
jgi:hypothetical protein